MTDKEKMRQGLNYAIDVAFGANCELVKIPVEAAINIAELLKEQDAKNPEVTYCPNCGAYVEVGK